MQSEAPVSLIWPRSCSPARAERSTGLVGRSNTHRRQDVTGVMLRVKKSEIVIVCILSLIGLVRMSYIPISNVIFTVIFTTYTPRDFKYEVKQCRVRGGAVCPGWDREVLRSVVSAGEIWVY